MKRFMCVALAGASVLAQGAELTYTPQGEAPYLWNNAAAWGGTKPGTEDTALLCGTYAPETPLTVSSVESIGGIGFGDDTLTKAGDRFFLNIASGGSLTVGTLLSANKWGVGAATNVLTVSEGGTFVSQGTDRIGWDDGSAVVITNRGSMTLTDMLLGYANRTVATFDNYGDLTVNGTFTIGRGVNTADCIGSLRLHAGSTVTKKLTQYSSGYTYAYVGRGGKGELIVENEFTFPANDQLFVGYNGEGSVLIQGDGKIANASSFRVVVASEDDAVGRLTLRDNARVNTSYNTSGEKCYLNMSSGTRSKSYLTMSGTSSFSGKYSGPLIASGVGSYAEIDLSGTASFKVPTAVMSVATAEGSSALIKLSDSATFSSSSHIKLGCANASTVTVEIAENASLTCSGIRAPRFARTAGSVVTVGMKGGKLTLTPYTEGDDYISLFGMAGSETVFRGYGSFPTTTYQPTKDGKRCRVQLRGKIIADGEGTDRDLTPICFTMNNPTDEANANGDSGWYAVNHGRLLLPHTDPISSGAVTIGDNKDRTDPALVNSLHVTVKGMPDANAGYVKVAMYAPDRTDLPAAVPVEKGDSVLGIWRMGYVGMDASKPKYEEYNVSTKGTWIDFTSADVKIRHTSDLGQLKKERTRIIAYRYDKTAGKWIKVSSEQFDPTNLYYTLTGIPADSTDAELYTLGYVALVARQQRSGLVIAIR